MQQLLWLFSGFLKKKKYLSVLFFLFFEKISRSEAKDLLGDDWIQRHRRIVQQNANQYRRVAWTKVCYFSIN
jgi:Exo70 exocyst complex subunit